MKLKYRLLFFFLAAIATPLCSIAQAPAAQSQNASTVSIDSILTKAVEQEQKLAIKMDSLSPIIETYTQKMEPHPDLGAVPTSDNYFLGKLDMSRGPNQRSMLGESSWISMLGRKLTPLYSIAFMPEGFASMLLLGPNFEKSRYDFTYVRREFLGEVRCFVFDVQPRQVSKSKPGFTGRIWIEDRDFNIVRFNGARTPSTGAGLYFHFDSWRENMGPGLWLPAYVYSEESDLKYAFGLRSLRFKGQTRLWAYNVGRAAQQNELTSLVVESEDVQDRAAESNRITSVEALRSWERQAEDNILDRLETAGLLAPDGAVNKVLETVINNLMVTNGLDIQPSVRARVLLTTPIESFTVGHTIVLSRGFVDVLPDEASLALVLAHELAHITIGHGLDTMYAFHDRTLFNDEEAFMRLSLQRTEAEELNADRAAAIYLEKSPYKDKLANAALFLRALQERAAELPHLLQPHLGNAMASNGKIKRMPDMIPRAPQLEMTRTEQISALPLGGRIRVDLWNNKIELLPSKNVPLQSAREKMPFEVTPVFLYLTRQQSAAQGTAQTR